MISKNGSISSSGVDTPRLTEGLARVTESEALQELVQLFVMS